MSPSVLELLPSCGKLVCLCVEMGCADRGQRKVPARPGTTVSLETVAVWSRIQQMSDGQAVLTDPVQIWSHGPEMTNGVLGK